MERMQHQIRQIPGGDQAKLARLKEICRGYTPRRKPAGSITRSDLAVYDSLVIRQAGRRSDKTRWPNGRFMKAGSYYGGPV